MCALMLYIPLRYVVKETNKYPSNAALVYCSYMFRLVAVVRLYKLV
jgi:hypothetical protein